MLATASLLLATFATYDHAVRWNRGTGIARATCPEVAVIAEWQVCWPPIARALAEGTCIAYLFGVATEDYLTEFLSAAGCRVYAFDPAANHPVDWMPNVQFHHWGLLSGAQNRTAEKQFAGVYGSTERGTYLGLHELLRRLGHDDARQITLMKMDCEGCEWEVWNEMHATSGPRALRKFGQLLTELHFSTSLRFSERKARLHAPIWSELVSGGELVAFASRENEGAPADRHVAAPLVEAGLKQGVCCRELSLIARHSLDAITSTPPVHEGTRRDGRDESRATARGRAHHRGPAGGRAGGGAAGVSVPALLPAPCCDEHCMYFARAHAATLSAHAHQHHANRTVPAAPGGAGTGPAAPFAASTSRAASRAAALRGRPPLRDLRRMPSFAPALLAEVAKRSGAAQSSAAASSRERMCT